MITNEELEEFRRLLRRVARGLWARRGPDVGPRRLARRHARLLAQLGTEGPQAVSVLAQALGLSLPAASSLTRELEEAGLVERREDPADRRRTLVALSPDAAGPVGAWLERRTRPYVAALETLTDVEREGFLKGLRALGDALMEESACGPVRSHHRGPHRRGPHPHRPL
jgi:DNA-binding MarR family transcriptional regulator